MTRNDGRRISSHQLGQHRKPIVLLNVNGFWNPLLVLLNHLRDAGFIHSDHLLRPIVVDQAKDVVPAILAAGSCAGVSPKGEPTIIKKL